jgi:hypothetical protein
MRENPVVNALDPFNLLSSVAAVKIKQKCFLSYTYNRNLRIILKGLRTARTTPAASTNKMFIVKCIQLETCESTLGT